MGGPGSGNWYRWHKQTTIEQTKRIDIRFMKKRGLLKPGYGGSLNWSCGARPLGNIYFRCFEDRLQLNFRFRSDGNEWQPIEQNIWFDRTPCHFGGERLWFLCPKCNRRVVAVCGDGPDFLCRQCYRLPYTSQQQNRMDRIISQKHKLGEQIFEHYDHGKGWGKKKGMHWSTFQRQRARYEQLETVWLDGVLRWFQTHSRSGPSKR